MSDLILAFDAGTTSVRALIATRDGRVLSVERRPLASTSPRPGWVEQDAEVLWRLGLDAARSALAAVGAAASDLAAVGVASQRASIVVFDRASGRPVAPMVVWSDLRGVERAATLKAAGFTAWPQTPACKLESVLAGLDAPAHDLAWGGVDTYLAYRLTGGQAHVVDLSSGSVSGYVDPAAGFGWNRSLIAHQGLNEEAFPTLVDTYGPIGVLDKTVLGAETPLTAMVADQQATLFAHNAVYAGGLKATYGTSAVLIGCSGTTPRSPHPSMPPEVVSRKGQDIQFGYEGMVLTAGSMIDWLWRDLGLFPSASALIKAAEATASSDGVRVRPALQGVGAPYYDLSARGRIDGLSQGARPGHIARAALEALAYRLTEIFHAAVAGGVDPPDALPVDGGLTNSDLFMQIQADALQRPVRRHAVRDGAALGAAAAAALGAGVIGPKGLCDFARYDADFHPKASAPDAGAAFEAWRAWGASD